MQMLHVVAIKNGKPDHCCVAPPARCGVAAGATARSLENEAVSAPVYPSEMVGNRLILTL